MAKTSLETLIRQLNAKKTGASLRKRVVKDHGADGVRALLASEHAKWTVELFDLDAPEVASSPWPYAGLSAGEVARRALGPLAERLPRLVQKLAASFHVAVCRHTPQPSVPDLGGWFLLYVVDESYGPDLWVGGPPTVVPEGAVRGWELPASLRELYTRHHGMGILCDELGWTGFDPGVQPVELLAALARPSDEDTGDDTPGPLDLLRFTRGVGESGESGWCFVRNDKPAKRKGRRPPSSAAPEIAIRDYRDAWSDLGERVALDFWGFLDRYLTRDDAGLPSAGEG